MSGIASTIYFASYTIEIGQKNTEILTYGVWNSENLRMFEMMSHRAIKEIANFGILSVIKLTFVMINDLIKGLWLKLMLILVEKEHSKIFYKTMTHQRAKVTVLF